MKLLARYPNNTKLIDSEIEDDFGNTQLIVYENGDPLTNYKVSGVVYINEKLFEVYSGKDLIKTGLFRVGEGFDWEAETPRQKYNRANAEFRKSVDLETKKLNELCYCSFPRIVDYIENRGSTEGWILKQIFQQKFLVAQDYFHDQENDAMATILNCKVCNSEYEWKYRERGTDALYLKINHAKIIGKLPTDIVPNYLQALFDEVFCKVSYISRFNLEKANLENTIDYLFDRNNLKE